MQHELTSAEGRAALATAQEVGELDPLAAGKALRARGVRPELAAAALTQVALRRRAVVKFGPDAARMLLTRAGVEQATRPIVAARRAARLRDAGVRRIADLGCGLGADSMAFARAGIEVLAVEADPETAAMTRANLYELGLADRVRLIEADAATVALDRVDAVFCDPARRSGGRRVFDPADYSPPWDFVLGLIHRIPRTVLKLAPGIDGALLPDGTELELVSVDGEVVEAAAWCGELARVPRRATVLRDDIAYELTGSGLAQAPVRQPAGYVSDPDGAVVRAHLVAEFAAANHGWICDPAIAYVWTDRAVSGPFARCFAVEEVLPFSVKRLRAALRERGVGRVEILKRGSAVDVEHLRRDLRLSGRAETALLLTRVDGRQVGIIARALPRRYGGDGA